MEDTAETALSALQRSLAEGFEVKVSVAGRGVSTPSTDKSLLHVSTRHGQVAACMICEDCGDASEDQVPSHRLGESSKA